MSFIGQIELSHSGKTDLRPFKNKNASAIRVEIIGRPDITSCTVGFYKKIPMSYSKESMAFNLNMYNKFKWLEPHTSDTGISDYDYCLVENLPNSIKADDKIILHIEGPGEIH